MLEKAGWQQGVWLSSNKGGLTPMFAIGLNASADHLQRLVELCQALEATGHDRLLLTESPPFCANRSTMPPPAVVPRATDHFS